MKAAALAVVLIVALPAQAQVYKCQDGGSTVYSQVPCGAAAQALDIKRHTPRPGSLEEKLAKREAYIRANPGLSHLVQIAIRAGVVTPGMTEEQALLSLGEPDDRNLTQTQHSSRWQWVYRRASGKQHYVYIENGIVVGTN